VSHFPTNPGSGVRTEGLGKRFDDLWALRDLDLEVPAGTVLGLLGHNGAGKTTALRILTTLSQPTTGRAEVAGFDPVTDPLAVRRRIGVTAQQATVDELLTARANLLMIARLHDLPKRAAGQRADELLARFNLADESEQLVKTFSGGMRRRLDLAASLVATPEVLFLDEPTTGLDPRSRNELWEMLRELTLEGCTIVLTTQYLDEADRLADDIVVLDHGRTVAHGTPGELKARVGDVWVDVAVDRAVELDSVARVIEHLASAEASLDGDRATVTFPLREGVRLIDVMRTLDDAGIDALDLDRREATLDDVFLTLTGVAPTPTDDELTAVDEPLEVSA
jgi:daunorubicin resistance ABC transporter ATP-binding subunit